ncbi:sensor histidine kinase [Lacisediminihabitans profunda]|uniref:histidine kinase n=1 Tax=Lacisediminihabitans profunda TaxID=2594790 RepID=A0A5C8UYM4_9MICO|nr:histidine kinase [Lacisediminihabitans profunda]TXN32856.1 sensor histidine kinase [Lacisediminihabitans profunda]
MIRTLRRYQLVTDISVAAAFFLVQVLFVLHIGEGWAGIVALLFFSSALGLRRLSPGLALGIAWPAAVVQMAAALDAPQFYDLAVLAVLFTTACYGGRVVRWLGLASAVLGSIVAAAYLVLRNGIAGSVAGAVSGSGANLFAEIPRLLASSLVFFFGCLAVLGLSWTLGLLARTMQRARASRAAQVTAEQDVVVEQERNRIARDMHDVVAHSLAVVIAQADGARYARETDPGVVDEALATISSTAREALGDVRILLSQMRHNQGDSPQPALADLDRLVEQMRSSGLIVSREATGRPLALATGQQLAVYRIVQEALTNALRHGDTSREVRLEFRWRPDALEVTVSSALPDDGLGAVNPTGHGIAGMRERAALFGGTFVAHAVDGRWLVSATLPVPPAGAAN